MSGNERWVCEAMRGGWARWVGEWKREVGGQGDKRVSGQGRWARQVGKWEQEVGEWERQQEVGEWARWMGEQEQEAGEWER